MIKESSFLLDYLESK